MWSPAGFEPPTCRIGLVNLHGEVDVGLFHGSDRGMEIHESPLQPQVVPIEPPRGGGRDKRKDQQGSSALNRRERSETSGNGYRPALKQEGVCRHASNG